MRLGVPTSTIQPEKSVTESALHRRTTPFFPDQPPSCPICAKLRRSRSVLQNFTNIIFNPGAFITIIKCACTDTFQSAFPQCVDCFLKTNQEAVLNTPNLPAVVDGMRQVCALESTLLGNVSNVNGETTPSHAPAPTKPASGAVVQKGEVGRWVLSLGVTLVLGLGSFLL
ncbi:hypothetical protein D9756_008751 [Leucocoprinus leucothites]|uniref:Uncharacterized protein n=1 Tax=Leucocoprinus leucothites TaxID=201217 RepID=A0A8H5D0X8_9AGAR|nr:hypothetical protein D9756_008751 [Leucoagaricus leucothites]